MWLHKWRVPVSNVERYSVKVSHWATGYKRSDFRTPAWAMFFRVVQTGRRAQPACCTMRTGSLYCGSRSRGVVLTTQPHLASTISMDRLLSILCLCATCGILQGDLYPLLNFGTQKNIQIYHGFLQFLQKTTLNCVRTFPFVHPIYCSSLSKQTVHFLSISQPSDVHHK